MNTNKDTAMVLRATACSVPDGGAESEVLESAARHFESLAERDDKDAKLQEIGECAAQSLAEMVAALECDYDRLEELRETSREEMTPEDKMELAELNAAAGDCEGREDAERRIQEDPLSVEVRSGWFTVGADYGAGDGNEPEEFCILLGTGGPAVRIIGELSDGQPTRARLQVQDWFTPWTDYRGHAISSDDLLTYCGQFYFGE